MIRPHIKEGVAGKAVPICIISEGSHVDRAIFNCLVHIMYDRPLESSEEIDAVWEQQMASEAGIMKLLKSIKKPVQENPGRYKLIEVTNDE
jgi:hypothetical protein